MKEDPLIIEGVVVGVLRRGKALTCLKMMYAAASAAFRRGARAPESCC